MTRARPVSPPTLRLAHNNMPPPPQPAPAHRQHQRLTDRLAKCIQYVKSPDGGGFKTFSDFMAGLFTELPTDSSTANDRAYQSVTQTVRAFLSWNPLKGFLNKISSHALMTANDGNTQGIVPFYCISPGLPTPEGMVLLFSIGAAHLMSIWR